MHRLRILVMKKLLFTSLLGLFALTSMAQEIGGCTSYFGDNYSPEATYNDSTCVYDLQQLLLDGTSIGDLLFSGVLESELVGLFAAGGIIVHVDASQGKASSMWKPRGTMVPIQQPRKLL